MRPTGRFAGGAGGVGFALAAAGAGGGGGRLKGRLQPESKTSEWSAYVSGEVVTVFGFDRDSVGDST